ncbi:MAG: hypothetical protein V1862_11905 [Methanobacteriota archaeon]
MEIFDYATSPLDPVLKFVTFFIFVAVFLIYLDTRKYFGGNVRTFIDLLYLFALFMAIGTCLRVFGDGTDFGFTKDYSLKWLQSFCYLVAGVFYVIAARRLLTLFSETT